MRTTACASAVAALAADPVCAPVAAVLDAIPDAEKNRGTPGKYRSSRRSASLSQDPSGSLTEIPDGSVCGDRVSAGADSACAASAGAPGPILPSAWPVPASSLPAPRRETSVSAFARPPAKDRPDGLDNGLRLPGKECPDIEDHLLF